MDPNTEGPVPPLGDINRVMGVPDTAQMFPLQAAVWWGHVEIVQMLIAHGAEVGAVFNSTGTDDEWELVFSPHNGSDDDRTLKLLQTLVEAGAIFPTYPPGRQTERDVQRLEEQGFSKSGRYFMDSR